MQPEDTRQIIGTRLHERKALTTKGTKAHEGRRKLLAH